ncbi:MAG: hypothetical protein GOVbin556_62 [Prokaryotic dsDNA virus sp.]|nr:MAG: hypothetical protein GOVbin556_62 [Prokaryotic dsDNA virus sp.]|tara:strand:+ start:27425 stop:29605 length:2181 start_codon:yes stop_codon:yes gene_type:complete
MHWMEVLKDTRYPDIRLITKSETIPLPANVGGRWQPYLINDSKAEEFIQLIKDGKYETKGITATISTLKQWRDDRLSFDDIPEISSIYREIYQDQHIADMKVRIDKIINEVLPILETKLKESKTTAKPTVSSSMTEEGFANLLDGFENKSDNEKEDIIEQLSILSKDTRTKFRDFLTENYADVVVPYLKQSTLPTFTLKEDTETGPEDVTYDKLKEVSFSSSKDFNTLNYQKMNNTWVKNFTKSTPNNLISSQVQQLDSSVKLDIRSHRLWILFGGQEAKEKVTETKLSLSGNIDAEKARLYFVKIAGPNTKITSSLRPDKLKPNVRRKDNWKDKRRVIMELLSPDFTIDDKMFKDFIGDMKGRTTLSDDMITAFTMRKVWLDSVGQKKDSDYYVILEGEDNSGLDEEKDWPKYKDTIRNLLMSDKRKLVRELENKNRSLSKLNDSLSAAKIEFLKLFLDPDEDDKIEISKILNNNKIISNLYRELLGNKTGEDKLKSIEDRLVETTFDNVTYFLMPKSNDRSLIIDFFREGMRDTNFTNLYSEIEEDVKEEGKSLDIDIQKIKGDYDFSTDFNLDKFSGVEKYMAEIAYMGFLKKKPENLADILFDTDTTLIQGALDLTEIVSNILSLAVGYSKDKRNRIFTISEEVEPTENIEDLILSNEPPYEQEIKEISKLLEDIVPEIRQGIIKDVEEKVKDIIEHVPTYEKEKKDILNVLRENNMIQVVN